MSRERDPLALGPHWRVDLRLMADLPEDNLVGTRFLVHVIFSAVTLAALLLTGLLAAKVWSLNRQVSDWEQRIKDSSAEIRDIKGMQIEYATEAAKIDEAWKLVRPQLRVFDFISNIGRTRPDQLGIDIIEWNDTGLVIRGSVQATSESATGILKDYLKVLNRDEKIGPLFREIVCTDLSPSPGNSGFKFETTFRFKGAAPKP
jgi:hypothetical protein